MPIVVPVTDVKRVEHTGLVYDFTIPGDETFVAGGVLVHNCEPCAAVDGTQYATMDDALVDYPGGGIYRACDGGDRCRGTLVAIFSTEDNPTSSDGPVFG